MLDQKHCDGNKNAFSGLNSRLDMAEERTYEPEDVPIENSKCEKQRDKDWGKKPSPRTENQRTVEHYGTATKGAKRDNGNTRGRKQRTEKKIEVITTQIFLN
jgi:hypothetical protein